MKSKTLFLIIILYTISFETISQTLFNRVYYKPELEYSNAVVKAANNHYFLAVSSMSKNGSSSDILLMNIDPYGNISSENYIGEDNSDEYAITMHQTSDNGYIIGGSSLETPFWRSYILKTDNLGNKVWDLLFEPSGSYEEVYEAFENSQGEYLVLSHMGWYTKLYNVGSAGSINWLKTFTDFFGYICYQTSDGGYLLLGGSHYYYENQKVVLMKTNYLGDSIWVKQYGDDDSDNIGYTMASSNDNGFILAGTSTNLEVKSLLIKINYQGDTIWTKKYYFGSPQCIIQTFDGGFIFSTIDQDYASGLFYQHIVKINGEGQLEWQHSFENRENILPGNNLLQLEDGSILLTGNTFYINSPGMDQNATLIKFDSDGNYITGIETNNDAAILKINIYPNPVTDESKMIINGPPNRKYILKVFDCNAHHIYSTENFSSEFKIKNMKLDHGLYFYKIISAENIYLTGKILKL